MASAMTENNHEQFYGPSKRGNVVAKPPCGNNVSLSVFPWIFQKHFTSVEVSPFASWRNNFRNKRLLVYGAFTHISFTHSLILSSSDSVPCTAGALLSWGLTACVFFAGSSLTSSEAKKHRKGIITKAVFTTGYQYGCPKARIETVQSLYRQRNETMATPNKNICNQWKRGKSHVIRGEDQTTFGVTQILFLEKNRFSHTAL